jgi:hypothetical protein
MDAISSGYANYYSNTAAVTSSPSNFGPGQVNNDNNQSDNSQAKLQDTSSLAQANVAQAATGYTTATRGSQLNISV